MPTVDDLQSVGSSSELHTMCESGRLLFVTAYDRLAVLSAELRLALSQTPVQNPGNGTFKTTSRSAARRVTRQLVYAAELQLDAAKAMRTAWFVYKGLYMPQAPVSNNKPKFDVNA